MGQTRSSQDNAPYGVGIKGQSVHPEADELDKVALLAEGHAERVHVFDKQSGTLVFGGNLSDLRKTTLSDMFFCYQCLQAISASHKSEDF